MLTGKLEDFVEKQRIKKSEKLTVPKDSEKDEFIK
jgi:hypothetical protein